MNIEAVYLGKRCWACIHVKDCYRGIFHFDIKIFRVSILILVVVGLLLCMYHANSVNFEWQVIASTSFFSV